MGTTRTFTIQGYAVCSACPASETLEFEPHVHELLVARRRGPVASWVAPILLEPRAPVERHRAFIVSHYLELELGVARPPGAVDARLHQHPADPHPPVLLQDTDPETRPVPHLAPTAHRRDSSAAHDLPIDDGDELDLIVTALRFRERASLLFIVGTLLIRVGQQVVGLRMRALHDVTQRTGIRRDGVPHEELHPTL